MLWMFWATDTIKARLENFLNKSQTLAHTILVEVRTKAKGTTAKPGSFVWKRSPSETSCIIKNGNEVRTFRSLPKGKLMLYTDCPGARDTIRPKDVSVSPMAAFFKPKVALNDQGHYRYTITQESPQHYVMVIHEWNDPKHVKQHMKVYFREDKPGHIRFTEWKILLKDQTTVIHFQD